ncbi:MAG: hypothetical protein ACK56I_11465, partial [bacterium]
MCWTVRSATKASGASPAAPRGHMNHRLLGATDLGPSASTDVVSREVRVDMLRRLMGRASPDVKPLARAIRAVAHRSFDEHVVPLVDVHWPGLRQDRFFEKLRIGACDLYASGPY